MKIAVLASRFPYPIEKGDKLRLFHQLRVLSQQHEIVLIALAEDPPSADDLAAIAGAGCTKVYVLPLSKVQIVQNLMASVLRGLPLQVGYFYNKDLDAQIQTILEAEKPDKIYCQLIRMALYAQHSKLPVTLDYMDNFSINTARRAEQSSIFTRWLWAHEARLTADFEAQAFHWFAHTTIISAQDRDLLPFGKRNEVAVIPNGVDTAFFSPDFTPVLSPNTSPKTAETYNFAFVGNMGYKPNVEAAKFLVEHIMPLVWRQNPNASLLIAGARPTPEVQRLQSERVHISGWIDDIREAYSQAKCLVAPLFIGSGQQNKILESMAMGVPCITTTLVNNAIKAKNNHEILLADDANAFAVQMLTLLADTDLHQKISENGLQFVQKTYSWEFYGKELGQLL
jgi:polysaccharide biosynthesis protein PslH